MEGLNAKVVATNGRDRFRYVRHVRLIGEQTGVSEDVYRIQETGRVCVRSLGCGGVLLRSGAAAMKRTRRSRMA